MATPTIISKPAAVAAQMKNHIDSHITKKYAAVDERKERREQLEKTMEAMNLNPDVKKAMQARLKAEEDQYNALQRKINVNDFETLTIIGRGAFGQVRVVSQEGRFNGLCDEDHEEERDVEEEPGRATSGQNATSWRSPIILGSSNCITLSKTTACCILLWSTCRAAT